MIVVIAARSPRVARDTHEDSTKNSIGLESGQHGDRSKDGRYGVAGVGHGDDDGRRLLRRLPHVLHDAGR